MPDGKKTKTTGENTSEIKKDKKGKDYSLAMHSTTAGVTKGDTIRPHANTPRAGGYISGGDYKAKKTGDKSFQMDPPPNKYTPFKMKAAAYGNSPMKKNFGVGEKESPKEIDNPNR